jgi:hypothetical protein
MGSEELNALLNLNSLGSKPSQKAKLNHINRTSPVSSNRAELETSPRCLSPGVRLATGKNCFML